MRARSLLIVLAVLVLAGGGYLVYRRTRPVLSDDKQITAAILGATHALEQQRVQSIMRVIADDYNDGAYSRQDLESTVRAAVLQADRIHIATFLRGMNLSGTTAQTTVDAEVSVAQTRLPGTPGTASGEPAQGRYTVNLEWRKGPHGWQITKATGWEQAQSLGAGG